MQLAANRGAAQAAIIGAVADNNAAGAAGIRESFAHVGQPIAAPPPGISVVIIAILQAFGANPLK
jgi:hypothetical protein